MDVESTQDTFEGNSAESGNSGEPIESSETKDDWIAWETSPKQEPCESEELTHPEEPNETLTSEEPAADKDSLLHNESSACSDENNTTDETVNKTEAEHCYNGLEEVEMEEASNTVESDQVYKEEENDKNEEEEEEEDDDDDASEPVKIATPFSLGSFLSQLSQQADITSEMSESKNNKKKENDGELEYVNGVYVRVNKKKVDIRHLDSCLEAIGQQRYEERQLRRMYGIEEERPDRNREVQRYDWLADGKETSQDKRHRSRSRSKERRRGSKDKRKSKSRSGSRSKDRRRSRSHSRSSSKERIVSKDDQPSRSRDISSDRQREEKRVRDDLYSKERDKDRRDKSRDNSFRDRERDKDRIRARDRDSGRSRRSRSPKRRSRDRDDNRRDRDRPDIKARHSEDEDHGRYKKPESRNRGQDSSFPSRGSYSRNSNTSDADNQNDRASRGALGNYSRGGQSDWNVDSQVRNRSAGYGTKPDYGLSQPKEDKQNIMYSSDDNSYRQDQYQSPYKLPQQQALASSSYPPMISTMLQHPPPPPPQPILPDLSQQWMVGNQQHQYPNISQPLVDSNAPFLSNSGIETLKKRLALITGGQSSVPFPDYSAHMSSTQGTQPVYGMENVGDVSADILPTFSQILEQKRPGFASGAPSWKGYSDAESSAPSWTGYGNVEGRVHAAGQSGMEGSVGSGEHVTEDTDFAVHPSSNPSDERVVEEVKQALRPFFAQKQIDRTEYKEILKRCVPKVSSSGEINSKKIVQLVTAYVKKFRAARPK